MNKEIKFTIDKENLKVKVERAFVIRRGAFYPQPNVDSAVVTFHLRNSERIAS